MDDTTKDALIELTERVEDLVTKVGMIGRIQLAIVDKIGEDDSKFQAKFMAIVLADDEFRADFTQHVFDGGDDDSKTLMMELNQVAHDLAEEIDNE